MAHWSERPGSNRPPEAWKATALPNELLSLKSVVEDIIPAVTTHFICFGAKDQARTGHPNLGKVVLYRMSYFRNLCGPEWARTIDLNIMSVLL